jgi:valyl-tRNA synthetase
MTETSTKYNSKNTEIKWYQYWLEHKLFKSVPDTREPFTIVIPPPNVTGVLHMGHILNNTIQDILIRRARMQGKNACWVPGTDHASIATEAKVVNKLAEEGIDKHSVSREEFMDHAWDWTHKHGGIILEQLKKLGASCDWDRTKFTLDKDLSESVIKVFIDLYSKGLIYRGIRMVNWDTKAKTAVSDEEVEYKDEKSKLYYVKYKIVDMNEYITIATTRPETILGDTAVCVHPDDSRYKHLHGKQVIIPLINREVPIIIDDYIDIEFGTGALKVTPAHDENDYRLGEKHNLQSFNVFNDNGTMSKEALLYENIDRFEVRKIITDDLDKAGNLVKIEDYTNRVGYSQRTQVPIEPKLSMQWFLKMQDIVKPAIEKVNDETINFSPKRFVNTYNHWMENIRDWNISRQLWWGHQIPAYYISGTNDFVVAENIETALKLAREKNKNNNLTINDLKQDEDVLDTWFSSWLWPISVFDGIRFPENEEIKYYYPTNVLATGHDIIFFWVARMIIAGYEFRNEFPFKNVYFTGMVRDEQRRKMSKQLGNSPDPLHLIDEYGADGVRFGMMLCSPAGGDLLYSDSLPEQGRNFLNKIWNAYRLTQSWEVDDEIKQPEHSKIALDWFNEKFNEQIAKLDELYDTFKLSEALMLVYKLFKDEFSSWLLEIVKPDYQKPIDRKTFTRLNEYFEQLLQILHPFMPFITEELWHQLRKRNAGESIMISNMPKPKPFHSKIINNFDVAKDIITQIRTVRKEKNISYKTKFKLFYSDNTNSFNSELQSVIIRLCGIENFSKTDIKPEGATHFVVKKTEFFIPLGTLIDTDAEIKRLKEELNYAQGFLNSVLKKLSNERFVKNAPADVIEKETMKQADAEAKIKALEEQILNLNS